MNYRSNKVAVAVAVGLGASVVGINTANADQLLFPYVAAFPTVTTLVSVVNDDPVVNRLHYHFYYKSAAAGTINTPGADCGEVNFVQNSSPNDLVTFDVSGVYGNEDTGVVFENNEDNENAIYSEAPANSFIGLPASRTGGSARAFLLVDNDTFGNFIGENLHGEVFVMEFESGAVWGYQAYNAAGIYGIRQDGAVVQTNQFEFSDRVETTGEVLSAGPTDQSALTSFMPFDQISTRFFVTPVATTANELADQFGFLAGGPFQFRRNLEATVALSINDPDLVTEGAIYDRDENPISGRVPVTVRCVAGIDATTMLDPGALGRVESSGGWSYMRVTSRDPAIVIDPLTGTASVANAAANSTSQVVAFKLEFNDSARPRLDGKRVGGIFNNGFWMKKGIRESQPRTNAVPLGVYAPVGDEINSPYPLLNLGNINPAVQLANGTPLDEVPVASVSTFQ